MKFETAYKKWEKRAVKLFDEVYDDEGPSAREIKDMKTDSEYECCVIELAIGAFCEFVEDNDFFDTLKETEKIKIVAASFSDTEWPRGNPQSYDVIKKCLKEMNYVEKPA